MFQTCSIPNIISTLILNRPIPIRRSQHVRRRVQQLIIHVSGRGTSGAVTIAAWLTPSPLPPLPPQKQYCQSLMKKGFSSTFKRILFTFLTEYCLCKQHPKIASFHICRQCCYSWESTASPVRSLSLSRLQLTVLLF